MPGYYAPLPGYEIRNAMLDFKPVDAAIDTFRQGQDAEYKGNAMRAFGSAMQAGDQNAAMGEAAKFDPQLALTAGKYGLETRKLQDEEKERVMKDIGGRAQALAALPDNDPNRVAGWKNMIDSDPRFGKALAKIGVDPMDHVGGPNAITQAVLGVKDPTTEAQKKAQTQHALTNVVPAGASVVTNGQPTFTAPQKLPQGYEPDPNSPGGARPIVGGPADIKFTEAKQKALTSVEATEANVANLKSDIQRVLGHPGLGGNYGIQSKLPNWPGGDSANANALLEQLRAKGGFATLQAMRDASKTGGALGNVSNAEGARLENAFAALQGSQGLEQVKQNLGNVLKILDESTSRLRTTYERQYNVQLPAETPTRSVPLPPGVDANEALSQARAAIKGGKDPEQIRQRLRSFGIDPGRI